MFWITLTEVRWPSGLRRCTQVKACRLRRSVVICIISGCVGSTPTLTTYLLSLFFSFISFLCFKSVFCCGLGLDSSRILVYIIWFVMVSGTCNDFSPSSMDPLSCRFVYEMYFLHLSSYSVLPSFSPPHAFPFAVTTHLIGPTRVRFYQIWEAVAFQKTFKTSLWSTTTRVAKDLDFQWKKERKKEVKQQQQQLYVWLYVLDHSHRG